jgi:enediyne biosynthesis thioesterase
MNTRADPTAEYSPLEKKAFVYRHVVSFEETNVMGNVYFVRYVAWQGRCREMFLARYAPDILDEMSKGLRLVTRRVSCDYFDELRALDEIEIGMSLAYLRQHRIGLNFAITTVRQHHEIQIALGFQEIGCMRASGGQLSPAPTPGSLARALAEFDRFPATNVS